MEMLSPFGDVFMRKSIILRLKESSLSSAVPASVYTTEERSGGG